jgi:Niemann-Pick C1 protein
VSSAIGIFGYLGIPATLIIIEVIPFLVLAVGVDNIFILTQTYQRSPKLSKETHSQHVGRIVGRVAPSMLLSSVSESTCFFLGGLSDMPAVRAFAFYAGMALLIDFLLQISCFVALMSLDSKRQSSNRVDIACCLQGKKKSSNQSTDTEGFLFKVIKMCYAPVLFKKFVRVSVLVGFFGWLCCSLAVLPYIDVGLDQELSMPEDSYVLEYFR